MVSVAVASSTGAPSAGAPLKKWQLIAFESRHETLASYAKYKALQLDQFVLEEEHLFPVLIRLFFGSDSTPEKNFIFGLQGLKSGDMYRAFHTRKIRNNRHICL